MKIFLCFLTIFFFVKGKAEVFDASGFAYKKKIVIENFSGENRTNEDVLIELDTQMMFQENLILENCADLVFVHEETQLLLPHYIENSCNMLNTRIYITMNLSTTTEANDVSMYYWKDEMFTPIYESYQGYFVTISDGECEGDWERAEEFKGKFPFISSTTASSFGKGTDMETGFNHSHLLVDYSPPYDGGIKEMCYWNYIALSSKVDHTHVWVAKTEKADSLPLYKEAIFCKSKNLKLSTNTILFFNSSTFNKEKFIEFSEFANHFPFGASENSFGGTIGGSESHSHYYEGETFESSEIQDICVPSLEFGHYVALTSHIHSFKGQTEEISNAPQHINFVMARNTEESISNSSFSYENQDEAIYLSTKLPPAGFLIREEYDGYFFKGSNISSGMKVESFIGNSGTPTVYHSHEYTPHFEVIESEEQQKTRNYSPNYDGYYVDTNHQHKDIESESQLESATLPFYTVMAIQRKPIVSRTTIGEQIELFIHSTRTEECDPTCQNEGKCIPKIDEIDNSIKFVCNCTQNFEGEDCSLLKNNQGEDDVDNLWIQMLFIIIGISVGSVVVLVILILFFVLCLSVCLIMKRKRQEKYNSKLISGLVDSVDKQEELKEEKMLLEEQKIKLQNDKEKMEAERKEEKKQLQEALDKLKQEKLEYERKNNAISTVSDLKKFKDDEIEMIKRLEKEKKGYESWKGKIKNNKEIVLLRIFNPDVFRVTKFGINTFNFFEQEIRTYSAFKHPNILEYKGMIEKPKVIVVTNFPELGTLKTLFSIKKKKPLNFMQKVRIFYELATALQFLHLKGIPHRSLSADNCFINKELRPLIDFGFNRTFVQDHIYSCYAAPELIIPYKLEDDDDEDDDDPEDAIELKPDIYAFGILMFEIVKQNFNLYNIEKGKKVKIGEKVSKDPKYRPKFGKLAKYYPNWFVNLVKLCWNANPTQRPTITRIKTIIETVAFGDDE